MSGPTRRSEEARRRKGFEPFVTIRADDLLAAACILSPAALRLWLLLHAAWRPTRKDASAGEAFVAYSQAQGDLAHGSATIAAAFAVLRAKGLIVLRRKGTRPAAQGAATAEAAVFDLPARHRGERSPPELPPNVQRPRGKIRINVGRLRADLRQLSPIATKLLAFAISHQHRAADGTLADTTPFVLPVRQLAGALGLSKSAVAEAAAELVEAKRLMRAGRPGGRRAAAFTLAPPYNAHERRLSRPHPRRHAMVTTGTPVGGHKLADGGASPHL